MTTKEQTELQYFSATQVRILQYSTYNTIHALCGVQIVLIFFTLVTAVITWQWENNLSINNLIFWYIVAIIFTLISMMFHACMDFYATVVFVAFSALFLAFNLIVFLTVLPRFWRDCTEPYCDDWTLEIFYLFFGFVILDIVVAASVCYQEFRLFRLEGTYNKQAARPFNYSLYQTHMYGENRLINKQK